MSQNLVQVGRLAFRQEGANWNCYWSRHQHSMDGAVFLGSLSMKFAVVPEHKQSFMDLMRAVFGTVAQDTLGIDPVWKEPQPAPESERSGSA